MKERCDPVSDEVSLKASVGARSALGATCTVYMALLTYLVKSGAALSGAPFEAPR